VCLAVGTGVGTTMAERQLVKRAELVREEVIDAALLEFAEHGYHQTSISGIAKRLGSGHSMFYRYFQNKRDIFDHASRQVTGRLVSAIAETATGRLTSLDDFRRYVSSVGMVYADMLTEEPRLLQLLVIQAAGVDQEMSKQFYSMFDGGVQRLSETLKDGIAAGYLRADVDVPATAQTIAAIPFGIALRYAQHPDRDALVAQTIAGTDLICRGLATRREQP